MRKLLFVFAAAALFSSCGGRDYYFAEEKAETYTDATAEFDTLSYAVGMNLGLNVSFNYGAEGMTIEPLKNAFAAEIEKSKVDQDFLDANREVLNTFHTELMRPYTMAKRMAMFVRDSSAKPEIPALFNEEYTPERVATALGHDMAQYVRNTKSKVNLHYLFQAMDDAMNVKDQSAIDANMKLTTAQLQEVLKKHYSEELPATIGNISREWLASVAERSDVEFLVCDKDTLYYRIENPGSELRATKDSDTVSFRFEGYNFRGVSFESTAKRASDVRKALEKVKADTTLAEDKRAERIAMMEKQAADAELPTIPLKQFRVKGAIEGMKLVGAGGAITLWMPSSLAYGERGNRAVLPNEAVVMYVEVVDVKPAPEAIALPKKQPVKITPRE